MNAERLVRASSLPRGVTKEVFLRREGEQAHGHAEDNNNDQAPNASFQEAKLSNPFCTRDELHQFDRLKVWELVNKPFGKMIIKLKWLWKNKKDEDQTVIRNKARLVAKGYAQEEGIDFGRIICLYLRCYQPEGFVDLKIIQKKSTLLRKALYGLKASSKSLAKYALEILKKHNMDNCHSIGTPLATKPKLDVDLSGEPVDQSDYRSKIGSLMYLTSSRPDLCASICYCARYQARPTQKHLKEVKRIFKYLKGTINMGLWYPKDSGFELTAFSDADHAGCINTRKSTSGGIQFLGDKLVSWMSKKQNCTAMSSAEAEYVALSASCAQVMWMRTQLKDYGFNYNKIPLYCDSQSAIAISCNPVQHSRTKHIHTRYHFIKEQVENSIIELYFVRTEYQLADMFTKALPEDRFKYLVRRIGMRCLTPADLEVLTNETA
ncbi:retrovirus-related pol polyprotein from transposon TNT 1-94 [Tanacetum coccineum]|uniref:Retrovirus-related pol polyprotein from transposon TNT 1-94 n=1 Tax=Tanacetum coccineum TaxID=301880 RepID=A0ABQ5E7P2_9ASTR